MVRKNRTIGNFSHKAKSSQYFNVKLYTESAFPTDGSYILVYSGTNIVITKPNSKKHSEKHFTSKMHRRN